jgi:hypothetical protein
MKLTPQTPKGVSNMGLTHVAVKLRNFGSVNSFQAEFLVDTVATDSFVPGSYEYGLAEFSFLNETTAGRVIFGQDNIEPLLGATALESVGIMVDPGNRTLKRLPAIPLK